MSLATKLQILDASFAALGRVALLLDADHHVLWAGSNLDQLVCPRAAERAVGRPIVQLLGEDLLSRGTTEILLAGGRDEGRRAFLSCPELGSRLVSVSLAPLPAADRPLYPPHARTLVVLRPAEDDHILLTRSAGDMGFVASSAAMLQIVHTIEQLQHSEVTVLITGESGTGKEVVARALHAHSPRRDGRFVAINCAALGDLLESELFGHVRGAFTSAVANREGRFELARGGTLFLDEIGDMPVALQVKLLRVIQERRFHVLGESHSRSLDARILAATNADLLRAVEEGRFREDLYYRLAVVPIEVPPLRDRPDDIEPLARHMLARIGSREGRAYMLAPDALRALIAHDWPGNVRQLQNALEYATVHCDSGRVHVGLLPPEVARHHARPSAPPTTANSDDLRGLLEAHRWNRTEAAKALGISRTTLWRRMVKAGMG